MSKDYKLIMSADQKQKAVSGQRDKIKNKAKYNKATAQAVEYVSELDRYDDLAFTKIPVTAYAKQGRGRYGIEYMPAVHGPDANVVLLDNQMRAAREFLSKLRGFGLLADCVGSGKTFEACIILSELAARGLVKSVLLVVPEQTLSTNWVNVLENKFGLGEGALYVAGDYDSTFRDQQTCVKIARGEDGALRPTRPIIVSTSDFASWSERGEELSKILFDIIIVDEAHNLSMEEGQYAKAMMLLSRLMQIKKEHNKTYCVLLSATPHSGNLDKMFRLWYFIRRRGGNFHDFEEKEDKERTEDYIREKEFYIKSICRGAKTVAEFIRISKQYEIEGAEAKYVPENRAVFMQYLSDICHYDEAKYLQLSEGEKSNLRDEFLSARDNKDIRSDVLNKIANSYHQEVMRSIMIRQPRQGSSGSKRIVKNVYILPVELMPAPYTIEDRGNNITIDYNQLHTDKAITSVDMRGDKRQTSVLDYIKIAIDYERFKRNDELADQYPGILFQKILNIPHGEGQAFYQDDTTREGRLHSALSNDKLFCKKESHGYYWPGFIKSQLPGQDNIVHMVQTTADSVDMAQKVFDVKYEHFIKIVRANQQERMVVFFDYDLPTADVEYAQWNKLFETLQERDPDIASRVVPMPTDMTTKACKDCETYYNEHEDAILLANGALFTEGINLQKGHIAINFQVTCDPLAMDQRIGRVDRLGQDKKVEIYSFASMNKLEGYSLTYFAQMGIIQDTNGDAIIIAGSNNELMAIRCPACGKVELISQEDYISRKKKQELYCNGTEVCRLNNKKGTEMTEINVHEFKCDSCGKEVVRGEGDVGYQCVSTNSTTRGKYVNVSKGGNRTFHCSKLCAIKRCRKFKTGVLAQKCPIVNSVVPLGTMACKALCDSCSLAESGACPEKCRFTWFPFEDIQNCIGCRDSECNPKPHMLEFDEDWVADCPVCKDDPERKGKLRKKEPRTFAAFIRALYNFKADNGSGFCERFAKEAEKTADIRRVLENDKM